MRRVRSSLTYANVVATLALFLALTGGAVWAADKITSKEIGKGAVKTKNLAKKAVKKKNLAKNAVTSAKIANGAVKNADIGDGAVGFSKLAAGTSVIASASGGPKAVTTDGFDDVPLSGPLIVTPVAGQPLTLHIGVRGTLTQQGMDQCLVFMLPVVNGKPLFVGESLVLVAPSNPPEGPVPGGISTTAVDFPIGLTEPGTPQSLGLRAQGSEEDCAPGSQIDQVTMVVTQAK